MEQDTDKITRIKGWITLVSFGMIFASFFYMIGILPLQLNKGYRQGIKIVVNDPAVEQMFGTTIFVSPIIWGQTTQNAGGAGWGQLNTHIYGSKNNAEVYLFLSKERGANWYVTQMDIDIHYETVLTWSGGSGFVSTNNSPFSSQPPAMQAPTGVATATKVP